MIVIFILIVVVLIAISLVISLDVFDKLRKQNVNFLEAVFLSFIFSIVFLLNCPHTSRLEVSRDSIWKYFWLLLLLVIGGLGIIYMWTSHTPKFV